MNEAEALPESRAGAEPAAVGLGWPGRTAFDPDGPGPIRAPDPVDVAEAAPDPGVSRETPGAGAPVGLGWAAP